MKNGFQQQILQSLKSKSKLSHKILFENFHLHTSGTLNMMSNRDRRALAL